VKLRRRLQLRRSDGEAGYTMIMTALVLIPLLAFAGLSVDVGSWYARGQQIQRAADAAALAGASLMPDFPAAQTEALTTARKNGFVSGGSITVSVTQRDERRIAVTIKDSDVRRYFSSLFVSTMSISRTATAEFVLPVPLGSPDNYFGNDPVNPPAAGQPGLWGNIHGVGTDNKSGDRYAAGCRGSANCSPKQNTEYRGYYIYSVDVPVGAGTVNIDAYDAGLYDRGGNEQLETGDRKYSTAGTTTTWTVLGPDTTLLDPSDASPACPAVVIPEEGSPATYKNKWATLCSVTSQSVPVRYWLKVETSGPGDGANRYSVRATSTGVAPTLSAYRDMSMFNNQLSVNPNFYLAKVDAIHKGKTFLVSLYDPGEINVIGAEMQVLDPTGAVTPSCKVKLFTNPTDSSAASTTTYSPCSIPTTDSGGGALYNGKLLSIEIQIPSTYSCAFCWWRIRYQFTPPPPCTSLTPTPVPAGCDAKPADTTTWSAAIKGDPVHLVNE
jgi:hypothetical protein